MSAHAGLLCTSVGHVFCPTWSILPLAMSWLYDIWYVLSYINSHTARKKKKGESLCVSSKARVGWAVVLTRVEVPVDWAGCGLLVARCAGCSHACVAKYFAGKKCVVCVWQFGALFMVGWKSAFDACLWSYHGNTRGRAGLCQGAA